MLRNIVLPAALGAFLAPHQVGAFSTPRLSAGLAAPQRGSFAAGDVPISIDRIEPLQRCIINGQPRFNGMCLFAESSDDYDELETELSTPVEAKNLGPDLSKDVSKSIIDLPSMPSLPKISLPFGSKDPTPPLRPPSSGGDAIAAALGGAVYGSAAGLYVDVATDIQSTGLPAQVPPVALGAAVGAAAFVGVNQGGIVGTVTKFIFAGPVNFVKNIIARKIGQIVDDVKSTPQRIQDAAAKKVEDIKVRQLL